MGTYYRDSRHYKIKNECFVSSHLKGNGSGQEEGVLLRFRRKLLDVVVVIIESYNLILGHLFTHLDDDATIEVISVSKPLIAIYL